MIVSIHITYNTTGSVQGLGDIIPTLESEISGCISCMDVVNEYIVIKTCNRFEVYAVTSDNHKLFSQFESLMQKIVPSSDVSYILKDRDSIKHLFRVVCGLDSMIIGENQIQHQVRECYIKGKQQGHVKSILTHLFDRAMIVGKRVRSETSLNKGAVSVGSASIKLAENKIGDLHGKSVTIIGTGDVASTIAKNLIGKNVGTIFVSNRTYSRALELASILGGVAVSMDMINKAMSLSDLVLVATSAPHLVIRKHNVYEAMRSRPNRKLLIIDVSVPKNVDKGVTDIQNVDLSNMDSLQSIALQNANHRRDEINSAENIIAQELLKMDIEQKEKVANDIIKRIEIKISGIRDHELKTAMSRSSYTNIDILLSDFSKAIVNKITAEIYSNLRKASRDGRTDTCNLAIELFGLGDLE